MWTNTLIATDSSDSDFAAGASDAGQAKKLAFNPQPANVAVNSPFNISVELLDRYGNAVNDGSTVDLVLGFHPKSATALNLSTTINDGVADFDGVALATAGKYTFRATDGKLKANSKKFVVSG